MRCYALWRPIYWSYRCSSLPSKSKLHELRIIKIYSKKSHKHYLIISCKSSLTSPVSYPKSHLQKTPQKKPQQLTCRLHLLNIKNRALRYRHKTLRTCHLRMILHIEQKQTINTKFANIKTCPLINPHFNCKMLHNEKYFDKSKWEWGYLIRSQRITLERSQSFFSLLCMSRTKTTILFKSERKVEGVENQTRGWN